MSDLQIKQFKLANNDDIICEVLEWSNEHDASLVIRSCLKIIQVEDFQRGVRFYAFRPWLSFNDNPAEIHVINSDHIIAQTNPSDELMDHYAKTIVAINKSLKDKKIDVPLDEMAHKLETMSEPEFDNYMEGLTKKYHDDDSNFENVIRFPDKSKLH
jgi:hypothetical protein